MNKIVLILILVLTSIGISHAEGTRGIVKYAQVHSLDFEAGAPEESVNYMKVCYRIHSTIPDLSKTKLIEEAVDPRVFNVNYIERDGITVNSRQTEGVELKYRVNGMFNVYAYLNSTRKGVTPKEVLFYSAFPRLDLSGNLKEIENLGQQNSYSGLVYPQYEKNTYCERIPFGKAYSESYLGFFYKQSGAVGYLEGKNKFKVNIFLPQFLGGGKESITFNESPYVAPIFGSQANLDSSLNTMIIDVAYFMNSAAFLSMQLDPEQLTELRRRYAKEISKFEDYFNIKIPDYIDEEVIIDILEQVGIYLGSPPAAE